MKSELAIASFFSLLLLFALCGLMASLGYSSGQSRTMHRALELGHAEYCGPTRSIKWKGECE